MKKTLLSLAFTVISICSLSQDSLVRYSEITFNSAFEKTCLDRHFLKKETNYFQLFIANGKLLNEKSIQDAEDRFYRHLTGIKSAKFDAKKNEKKVKHVYEDIHNTFLVKYELENRFEDIFQNGFYNCVSASALYGLAFKELNIPFTLKEKPTHVYLIAFPDAERVMVETTTPTAGFNLASPAFKQSFVKMLKDQKLISAQEYNSRTVDELFDKFFFENQEDISLSQLVGLQYYNEGLFLFDNKKYQQAIQQLEKAYLFYPSERIQYLLFVAVQTAFVTTEIKDLSHAACLAKISRQKKYGIQDETIKAEYQRVIQDLLFEKGQKQKLEDYNAELSRLVLDTALNKELNFIFLYEQARLLYNQARYKESLDLFKKCLRIKPADQETNNIFIACLSQSLRNNSNKERIRELETLASGQPSLQENNKFNELLVMTYLLEIRSGYDRNPAETDKLKSTFETFVQGHKEVTFDHALLGDAYSQAAVHYFRKGQTSKAKAIIAKGLELSPENYELLTRRRMMQ